MNASYAESLDSIHYPDRDGKPMADNTLQFQWIVTIKENLERLFADQRDVFVAGDLLWYPVEKRPDICTAPDALVVFGRPKGYRGSYQQWREGDSAPQVVFEILSPGNRLHEMAKKLKFYEQYGVEEYYLYDPDKVDLTGWLRRDNTLAVIEDMNGWISPRLAVRFVVTSQTLEIYRPDGQPFLTFLEVSQRLEQAQQRADLEQQRANLEQQRADLEQQRADLEQQRAVLLADELAQERQRYQALLTQLQQRGIALND